jgi:hypothetical protein
VFLLQSSEVSVARKGVSGMKLGLMPDYTTFDEITKT